MVGPEIVGPIAGTAMVVAIVIGLPLARAYAKKMEREGARTALPPELMDRLQRMEQSIDSIAVEVERISEGQRFTTKLLSERTREPGGLPAGTDRP